LTGNEVYRNAKAVLERRVTEDDHLAGATTFDIWTCKHSKRSFMGCTYHYIDCEFEPQHTLLAASFFPHPHTAETINGYIQDTFSDWNLNRSRIHVTDQVSSEHLIFIW
jgi:hypothetical protein